MGEELISVIHARIQAIDNGTAVGIPYEEVMRQAQSRLTDGNAPALRT